MIAFRIMPVLIKLHYELKKSQYCGWPSF